jgi:hypothetical protein
MALVMFKTDDAGNPVPLSVAKDMLTAYKLLHASTKNETIYEWFSITELIRQLQTLQRTYSATGCRIYFGVITQSAVNIDNSLAKHLGKLTMIFIGTKERGSFEDDLLQAAGYDFGTLCPPGNGNHDPADPTKSLYREIFP